MSPRPATRPGVWAAALIFAAGVGAALWSGCEVTTGNYETLSFFFDGVPDPSKRVVSSDSGGVTSATLTFIHKPYLDEKCAECHESKLPFTRRDASGCLSCHEAVASEHRFEHGPVAAAACLWCHTPHESAFPHLLREADRALCTRCHSPSLLSTERVPAHADASRACLDCHTGHGGDVRFMLRDDWPAEPGAPGAEER